MGSQFDPHCHGVAPLESPSCTCHKLGPPAWAGLILVLLAMAMYVTGELSAIYILAQIGFIGSPC